MYIQERAKSVMRKTLLLGLALCLIPVASFGQSVDDSELQSVGAVEFVSYVGPHAIVDSLEAILNIGRALAAPLSNDTSGSSDYAGKYLLDHIVSPNSAEPRKLDADILTLTPSAGVDHIRNLRHIISAFLQDQYGFPADNANTISLYITYYNAFYRGNIDYFTQKYKAKVLEKIDPASLGLSTNYIDWPGATQIIIPLRSSALLDLPAQPSLDEAGQAPVDKMMAEQEGPSNAQSSQKDMLNMRDEQLRQNQQAIDEKNQQLTAENQKIQLEMQQTQSTLDNTSDLVQRQEAEAKQAELKNAQEQNQVDQAMLNTEQQTVAQRQQTLQQDQTRAANAPTPSAPAEADMGSSQSGATLLYPTATGLFRFDRIDVAGQKILQSSELNSIRNRDIVRKDSSYIVVAGEEGGNRRIRLLELDSSSFEITKEGSDDIARHSGVWQLDGVSGLLSFVRDKNQGFLPQDVAYLGLFDENFTLLNQSKVPLLSTVPPQVVDGKIVALDPKNNLVLLDPAFLTVSGNIQR